MLFYVLIDLVNKTSNLKVSWPFFSSVKSFFQYVDLKNHFCVPTGLFCPC